MQALLGLAPYCRQGTIHIKNAYEEWGSRGLAPLGCLPLWGREGVTLVNSTEFFTDVFSRPSCPEDFFCFARLSKKDFGIHNQYSKKLVHARVQLRASPETTRNHDSFLNLISTDETSP